MAKLLLMKLYPFILTHCILVDSPSVIYWTSPLVIIGVLSLFCCFYSSFDGKSCLVNTVGPGQMPQHVASDLGLHCLPMTIL